MDDALLEWYVADLTADIADVESQLTEATADEKVALEACLMDLETKFETACGTSAQRARAMKFKPQATKRAMDWT